MSTTLIDITGQKFGRLTVLNRAPERHGHVFWSCICECGNQTEVNGSLLRKGTTKSCGCLTREKTIERSYKHGLSNCQLYSVWGSMIQRCENKKRKSYPSYGGRGITVCIEWRQNFKAFYDWAINNGYQKGLTLDRIDNDGNYTPDNCRWANLTQQRTNRSDNHMLTFKNETKAASLWAAEYGIRFHTLLKRISLGWTVEQALLTPVNMQRSDNQ